ncbi:MAG TPA: tRNA (guanosine(37)-N1)-methyltransferase TrmD [Clostridiales bacterium]|nr:tRNA (guanosine(37)-N1)-methyltransferase TrmD [Clostridiales bacterium]
MRISVLTLFPEIIRQTVDSSITGRALQNGLFELETIQIRDFAVNRYGKVDDYCFGGGTGMLMMAEPVWQAHQTASQFTADRRRTIYLSPRGQVFNQAKAAELAEYDHLILLCGHYEGIDQRVLDRVVDEELSIGDYVLTGGELAACVVIDAMLRMVHGVLPNEEAFSKESHMEGLLEYPQYTRPAEWQGQSVPPVLLSGHQANIEKWQRLASLKMTLQERPDLFAKLKLTEQEWQELIQIMKGEG